MGSSKLSSVRRVFIATAVFLTIWGVKLATIGRYGTDVPYWDQWAKEGELLYAPWFERHELWDSLLLPHNEHRIAPTLAFNLGLLRASSDQWDARVQCVASGALHALLAAGLVWWAVGRLPRRSGHWFAVLLTMIAAPPIAWENVLCGFQSQFYFLALFSLLAIGGLLGSPARSWRWFGGLLCAILACVSMGSGMLVALPVIAIAGWRHALTARSGRPQDSAAPEIGPSSPARSTLDEALTLLVALAIGGIGWWLRPLAPWHAPIHAHSIGQSLAYAARCLAWPRYEWPWLALIFWAPWAILVGRRLWTRRSETWVADFALSGGLWVLVQVAAVSYSRAGASDLPAPRYGDICALGLAFNFIAGASLVGAALKPAGTNLATPNALARRLRTAVPLGVWMAVIAIALGFATNATFRGPLPTKEREARLYEQDVRAFVLTDDFAAFAQRQAELPFPSAEWLAKMLRNSTLRRLLPASIREPITLTSKPDRPDVPSPAVAEHGRVRTINGAWDSAPVTARSGWWRLDVAGEGTIQIRSASDNQLLFESEHNRREWRTIYAPIPSGVVTVAARSTSPQPFSFTEPTYMSRLSHATFWLTGTGWIVAALGLLGLAATLFRDRSSHRTQTGVQPG